MYEALKYSPKKIEPEFELYGKEMRMQDHPFCALVYDLPGWVQKLAKRFLPERWVAPYQEVEKFRVSNNLPRYAGL